MPRFVRAHAASWSLVAAAASWGIATVVSKRAVEEIPPLTLLPIELAVSVAVVSVAVALTGERVAPSPELRRLGLLGVLNPGLSYALSLAGLARITASTSVLLWAVEPLLILSFAWVLLRQPVTARLLRWSLLALLGVALVVVVPGAAVEPIGIALTVAGVAACALYTVLSSCLVADASSLSIVLAQQAVALAFSMILFIGVVAIGDVGSLADVSLTGWMSAIVAGALYYAVAFWFYIAGLRQVRPAVAGMFLNLIPVFGLAASRLLLDERLTDRQWLGAGLVIVAVAAIAHNSTTAPRERDLTTSTIAGREPQVGG